MGVGEDQLPHCSHADQSLLSILLLGYITHYGKAEESFCSYSAVVHWEQQVFSVQPASSEMMSCPIWPLQPMGYISPLGCDIITGGWLYRADWGTIDMLSWEHWGRSVYIFFSSNSEKLFLFLCACRFWSRYAGNPQKNL